jgi:hypothetical protein
MVNVCGIAEVGFDAEAADDRRRALYLLKELGFSGGNCRHGAARQPLPPRNARRSVNLDENVSPDA